MSVSARAEYLADTSELAAWCAQCFCRARCAGADVKAISPAAKAAVALGAGWDQLRAQSPPYGEDGEYMQEAAEIRVAVRMRMQEVRDVLRDAEAQASFAAAEMRRAIRDRNYGRYLRALALWLEARHAISVCHETLSRLERADRCLAWAPARYCQVYEGAVTFAAKGGLLPHDGRWIDGSASNDNQATGA